VCPAIQMGRPTKYTSSASSNGVRSRTAEMSHSSSSSSTSHLGCVISPWYQLPSPKSLLQRQLLVLHHSLHAADAVNRPWLMTSPDVSLSPDSTVKELEQSSSDTEDFTQLQHDENGAVNLCQKSVVLKVHQIPSRMSELSTTASTSSVSLTDNSTADCRQSLPTQLARRSSSTSSIVAHIDNATSQSTDRVLNLSVKPLQPHHQKSSSHRTTSMASFSHTDDDSDSSGCLCSLTVCYVTS